MYQYINLDYLHELSDGNILFQKEMITTFLERVPFYIEGFQKMKLERNWADLQHLAHKARSSFQMMGIQKLADDAALLELYCKEGIREVEIEVLLEGMIPYFFSVEKEMNIALMELNE